MIMGDFRQHCQPSLVSLGMLFTVVGVSWYGPATQMFLHTLVTALDYTFQIITDFPRINTGVQDWFAEKHCIFNDIGHTQHKGLLQPLQNYRYVI